MCGIAGLVSRQPLGGEDRDRLLRYGVVSGALQQQWAALDIHPGQPRDGAELLRLVEQAFGRMTLTPTSMNPGNSKLEKGALSAPAGEAEGSEEADDQRRAAPAAVSNPALFARVCDLTLSLHERLEVFRQQAKEEGEQVRRILEEAIETRKRNGENGEPAPGPSEVAAASEDSACHSERSEESPSVCEGPSDESHEAFLRQHATAMELLGALHGERVALDGTSDWTNRLHWELYEALLAGYGERPEFEDFKPSRCREHDEVDAELIRLLDDLELQKQEGAPKVIGSEQDEGP